MRFDKRRKNGASTLIAAMLVAIVALAGTAVYAAISSNASHDGYALPGSTLKYDVSYENYSMGISPIVVGYSDGYILNDKTTSKMSVGTWDINDELKDQKFNSIDVDVPGLGKTVGNSYVITVDDKTTKVVTILHGLIYSYEQEHYILKLTSGNFHLGDYKSPDIKTVTLNATSGTGTLDLNCVSSSTDGSYIFEFAGTDGYKLYYMGNEKGVPTDLGKETSYSLSYNGHEATMTFADGALSSITVNSTTYEV